jgi:hypothetical protein
MMESHPIRRTAFRPPLAVLSLLALTALASGACRADPPETPVRTTSASGSWTAPSAKQAADRDRALVRVVSAIPGASRLDLFADGVKLAEGIEYRTVTPFVEVASGRQALRLRPAGMDTAEPLADENHNFRAGQHYTVIIMPGEDGGPAAVVRTFDDPMDVPDEGRAAVRVIHAGADAGRVDVHVQERQEPLARALDFQGATDFVGLEPPASLELRPADRTETMLRVAELRLAAGGMYTVVVIGRTRTDPPLETLLLEDRLARQ